MDRELDVKVSYYIFGYGCRAVPNTYPKDFEVRGKIVGEIDENGNADYVEILPKSLKHYSSDLNAAYEVEEKIAEMGLTNKYIDALVDVVGVEFTPYDGENLLSYEQYYAIIHASAENRCKAALAAVQNKMKQDAFLADSIERVKKHKYQEANPEPGCDKTFECCRKLGNEKYFGGFAPVYNSPGSEPVRCQFKFKSKECRYVEGKR
jgi:hypothetical protein